MATSRLSQSRALSIAATVFGTIFVGFGVNAILRPLNALEPFELHHLGARADKKLIDSLMIVYGIRDVFMGAAIYATAYYGNNKALGWISLAGSAVAFVDGFVCSNIVGKGEWNHWGYAPMLTVLGSLLLGIFDGA